MKNKYELTDETMEFHINSEDVYTLYRIRALEDFGDVKKGDLGGWVESESNLSQKGNCWIYDESKVFNNARICDNGNVHDEATVRSGAVIQDNARILNQASIRGRAHISGNSIIKNNVVIRNALLLDCKIQDEVKISGTAMLNHVYISDNAIIRPSVMMIINLYNCHIGKDAYIQNNSDILSIYMSTDRPDYYHFYKKRNGGINVLSYSYCGKISDFKKEIKDRYFNSIPPNIASMLNMVQEYFYLNRLENNSEERHD